jgi:sugar O-acyltransferase (sialic acid O-acetyltransferase NeuD family)
MNKSKPVIILGSGGHASVLLDILLQQNVEILAVVSPVAPDKNSTLAKYRYLSDDDDVFSYSSEDIELINGVGFIPNNKASKCSGYKQPRHKLFHYFKKHGYSFKTIISDFALLSPSTQLEEGVQIMHGCILQPGVKVKANTIINTRTIVEHGCKIAKHNHIATGAIVCGDVTTEDYVFIGAGATVIQGLTLGESSVIAAGALIRKNVAAGNRIYANKLK